jgi:hypothetical protein
MKRKCEKCGDEYTLGQLSFDSRFCPECKPGFLGTPLWIQPIQAGTRDLWRSVLGIHIVMLCLFCVLFHWRVEVTVPGGIYCLTVIAYLVVRSVIASFHEYPILTKPQAVAMMLLPAYGPAFMIYLFNWAQRLRWGP